MHRRHHHLPERHSVRLRVAAVALLCAASATSADAQRRSRSSQFPPELRGSKASVQKMWDFAVDHGLTFYRTPADVDQAVAAGKLVQLTGDSTYELSRGVGFSYATKEARQFVLAFAPQYYAACGAPLMVTSAARPTSRQPRNANPYSVHPTGIAIDIRRPPAGPCQKWLRGALAQLEDQGLVEATEERHPVHVHVAVLTVPGKVASLPLLANAASYSGVTAAASQSPPQAVHVSNTPQRTAAASNGEVQDKISTSTYRVREGDTLWEIAQRSGVSVADLARANRRSQRAALRPGVMLRIPRE